VKVLVIDVGGTHVKLLATGRRTPVKFDSGPRLTPAVMVRESSPRPRLALRRGRDRLSGPGASRPPARRSAQPRAGLAPVRFRPRVPPPRGAS
jgi:hypothetical protein